MQNFNRPLVPNFLKRLDNYLLKNKPDLWSTRVHLAVWYSLLTTVAITFLYYLGNRDAREETFFRTWYPYVLVLCILGLITYIFYVVRFNVFKRFGNLNIHKHGARQFFFSAVAIASMCLPLVVPSIAESFWANNQYKKLEIVQDAAAINFQYHIVEKTASEPWSQQHVKVVSDTNDIHLVRWMDSAEYAAKCKQDSINAGLSMHAQFTNRVATPVEAAPATSASQDTIIRNIKTWTPISYRSEVDLEKVPFGDVDMYLHTSYLDSILKEQDSVISKGNNEYIFYTCPALDNCTSPFTEPTNNGTTDTNFTLATHKQIYYQLKAYGTPKSAQEEQTQLQKLCDKYITHSQVQDRRSDFYATQAQINNDWLYDVESSMSNIADKMRQGEMHSIVFYLNVTLVSSICLALLLFIFRHTTQKTFWLSALVLMLVLIVTSLLGISLKWNDDPASVYFMYTLIFAVSAASTYKALHRKLWQGIAINISVIAVCALPAVVFTTISNNYSSKLYALEQQEIYTAAHEALIASAQAKVDFMNALSIYMPSICFILCLILFAFVFAPLYKKWYSMPVN
jgi:hypothetical protein